MVVSWVLALKRDCDISHNLINANFRFSHAFVPTFSILYVRTAFSCYDKNKNGKIESGELPQCMLMLDMEVGISFKCILIKYRSDRLCFNCKGTLKMVHDCMLHKEKNALSVMAVSSEAQRGTPFDPAKLTSHSSSSNSPTQDNKKLLF